MFSLFGKEKWEARFVVRNNDTYTVIGKKKLKPSQNEIRYKENTFTVDYTKAVFRQGNKNFLFFEMGKGQLEGFQKGGSKITPDVVDHIISKSIVKQLVSSFNPNVNRLPLAVSLILIFMGVFLGYILGYIFPIDALQEAARSIGGG